jgi:hypothetical protein
MAIAHRARAQNSFKQKSCNVLPYPPTVICLLPDENLYGSNAQTNAPFV